METLKSSLRKNGIDYRLLNRTGRVALFELRLEDEVCGYEVARIIVAKEGEIMGRQYPEREVMPSDDEFGRDGSKCFFARDRRDAENYLQVLTERLSARGSGNAENVTGELKKEFMKNGLFYSLIRRNKKTAMYLVNNTHVEVAFIRKHEAYSLGGAVIPAGESLPGNEEFGISKPDRCFQIKNMARAEKYYMDHS
jgi:hypothetical protein